MAYKSIRRIHKGKSIALLYSSYLTLVSWRAMLSLAWLGFPLACVLADNGLYFPGLLSCAWYLSYSVVRITDYCNILPGSLSKTKFLAAVLVLPLSLLWPLAGTAWHHGSLHSTLYVGWYDMVPLSLSSSFLCFMIWHDTSAYFTLPSLFSE